MERASPTYARCGWRRAAPRRRCSTPPAPAARRGLHPRVPGPPPRGSRCGRDPGPRRRTRVCGGGRRAGVCRQRRRVRELAGLALRLPARGPNAARASRSGGLYRAADVGASRSAVLATRLTGLTGGRARVHTVHAHASSLLSDYRTLLGRRVAPAAPARQPWGPLPRLEALLRALGRPSLQENRARARAVPPVRDSGAEAPPASRVAARTELWSKAATPAAVRRPKPGVIFVHCAEAPGAGDEASLDRSLVTAGRVRERPARQHAAC